jgi:hypothetical protein
VAQVLEQPDGSRIAIVRVARVKPALTEQIFAALSID